MSKIILASGSPRRRQLMEQAGFSFEVMAADVDETNPPGMPAAEVPAFLASKKAAVIAGKYPEHTVVAADTIVILDEDILGKPADADEAISMLSRIAGRKHDVVTGVCIRHNDEIHTFSIRTEVHFRPLTDAQIRHYVQEYQPMDKAGSYAIQEWIGLVGIDRIDGDFYNVMGLPINEVYHQLKAIGH